MKSPLFPLIAGLVFVMSPAALAQTPTWKSEGKHGAVAGGGAPAVAAALETLQQGGNAADAAATMILAMSVTDSSLFCFGGEVPILVYDAKSGGVEVIAGQGVAPRLATREHFSSKGGIPGSGIESATVPAALDACLTLLDRHGTWTFTACVQPTLKLLREGSVQWQANLARTIEELIAAEAEAKTDRRRGLRLVSDYFYRGPIARRIDAWSRSSDGLIRYGDLAAHVTRVEETASATYRGHTVYKCGFWTQGPYVLEALQMLEGFELTPLGHNSPESIHLTLEAMKLALADRDVYYADPLFVDVPARELLAPAYASQRRKLIDPQQASLEQRPGDPRSGKALLAAAEAKHGLGGPASDTTTCVVADSQGNMIAATPSGWTGSLAGDTGVWLGSRLQSFNLWPDHPNCLEPGKRPRITLTPTIVLKDGKPMLAISVAGGDGQDQATLQMIVSAIDFGLQPADAVTTLRFGTQHHVGSFLQTPAVLGSLSLDEGADAKLVEALKQKGHKVELVTVPQWNPIMLSIDPKSKLIRAAGDPRAKRHAGAF